MGEENQPNYTISQENWSLHRKGYDDQQRHQEKVQEAIKNNLPDLVTEESIVMSNGKDVVKIPIRSLDEYKIRYNYDKNKHVGQGMVTAKLVMSLREMDQVVKSKKDRKRARSRGDAAGEDYYEAEVSILELEASIFQRIRIPNLKRKEMDENKIEHVEFNDIRKTGLWGNIDKKRTMISAYKRNAMRGKASSIRFTKKI